METRGLKDADADAQRSVTVLLRGRDHISSVPDHVRGRLTLFRIDRMKHLLRLLAFPDQCSDCLARALIRDLRADLAVVPNPLVERYALLAHRVFQSIFNLNSLNEITFRDVIELETIRAGQC